MTLPPAIVLAQAPSIPPSVMLVAAIAGLVLLTFMYTLLIAKQYKRCPSNHVLVIYGRSGGGKSYRCVHGGAAFVVPLLQDCAYLSLKPIDVEVSMADALSRDKTPVTLQAVATVAIGASPELIDAGAVRLLGLTVPEISRHAFQIIEGWLRRGLAALSDDRLSGDWNQLVDQLSAPLDKALNELGLTLVNFNLRQLKVAQ